MPSFESSPQVEKPRLVSERERQNILEQEEQSGVREKPKAPADVSEFVRNSQGLTEEAARWVKELIQFQKDGTAEQKGIENYRNRLNEIGQWLMQWNERAGSYDEQGLSPHERDQVKHLMGKNMEMAKRIEEALAESARLQAGEGRQVRKSRRVISPAPVAGAEQTPAESVWAQQAPVQEKPKKGLWSRLKSWFPSVFK